jgi:uncharacterized protein (TIGR03382 family)
MKRSLVFASVLALTAGSALAIEPEYCTGFEGPDFTPGVLTGQDSWYLPAVAGSVDVTVGTYGGPIAPNPTGGSQFIRAQAASSTAFARGQHDLIFDPSAQYTFSYDINVLPFPNKSGALNNIGSFSTQNSATARFTQSLLTWNDLNNPGAGWTTNFVNIDAAGANLGFFNAGAGFTGLLFNHWYRTTLTVDFATNALLSIAMTDIATNTTVTAPLTGVYMGGGANNALGLAMPTAFRVFGGGDQNNVSLWDNVCLEVVPAPATGTLALLGVGMLARRRRN